MYVYFIHTYDVMYIVCAYVPTKDSIYLLLTKICTVYSYIVTDCNIVQCIDLINKVLLLLDRCQLGTSLFLEKAPR